LLYDITPPITSELRVFPGDTPPSREVLLDLERGDRLTLSTLHTTVHVGAHADAASHYGAEAPSIEKMPLDRYLGECQVVKVSQAVDGRIVEGDWLETIVGSRVLLATGSYPDPTVWSEEFLGIDPNLVAAFAARGVTLVGIDTPSVDPATSKDLPAHQAFLAHDIAILEGIVLTEVPEGRYELIALPLPLVGFDASPVRAVLRTLPPE